MHNLFNIIFFSVAYFMRLSLSFGWIYCALLNSTTERFLSAIFAANILPFLSIASFMVYTIVCIVRECHSTGFYALQYAAMGQISGYVFILWMRIYIGDFRKSLTHTLTKQSLSPFCTIVFYYSFFSASYAINEIISVFCAITRS